VRVFSATLLLQGREILRALRFIHTPGLVHTDVKGDNIFIDATGKWLLGDFGPCRPIGEEILSTTDMFCFCKLLGEKDHPKYDLFMLLVVLLIESLPNKHDFESAACVTI
jgi:serine/threonine protein kinase